MRLAAAAGAAVAAAMALSGTVPAAAQNGEGFEDMVAQAEGSARLSAGLQKADAAAGASNEAPVNFITFLRIDEAWKKQAAYGKGERVAILDWSFDMSPAAAGKYVSPTSLLPGEPFGDERPSHGEWMAQIVHRIAPEAKIMPIRARPSDDKLDPENGRPGYEKHLIEGIRLAADRGAAAVTCSMGPVVSCPELTAAIDYAESKGTIFVDVHPEMIRVPKQADRECVPGECDARILHSGVVAVPNHGAEPEASRDVYVWPYPMDPGYKDGWGYSQGPPEVAGVVALMKSVNPKLTPQEIRDIVKKTARPLDGFAVLDAEAAVSAAGGKDAAGR